MNRGAFLDLNGTLVMPVLVQRLDELQPVAGVESAVARLSQAGFICPVVTIQSRIEKGLFSMDLAVAWRNWGMSSLPWLGGFASGAWFFAVGLTHADFQCRITNCIV